MQRLARVKTEQRPEMELCVVTKVFPAPRRLDASHGPRAKLARECGCLCSPDSSLAPPDSSLAPQTSGIQHSFHESPWSCEPATA